MARMFGQFAVQTGTKEARKRVEQAQEQVGAAAGRARQRAAAGRVRRARRRRQRRRRPAEPAPRRHRRRARVARRPTSLAIPDYDALSASQVVPRLAGLAADELDAVRRYEAANRGRKTILSKIAQLQAA